LQFAYCTYELEDHDFDYQDPWLQILANCAWAIHSTLHTVLNTTPAQIVFGRDMLFDLFFTTECKEIGKRKQEASDSNTHTKKTQKELSMNTRPMIRYYLTEEYFKGSSTQKGTDRTK
jgi:hypothetical protein